MSKQVIYGVVLCLCSFCNISFGQIIERKTDTTGIFLFPRGIAYIGSENIVNTGYISLISLRVQKGISCLNVATGYHSPCKVKSYNISIIRGNCIIFNDSENSAFFTKEMKEQFNKARKGDKIVIYNILAQFPLGEELLPSIVYELK